MRAALVLWGVFLTGAAWADAVWVTPAGHPVAACTAYRPVAQGPKLCFARPLTQEAADLAACASEGGTARMSDSMKPAFVCGYPRLDAGKACKVSTDCELACDALSHECRAFSGMGQGLGAAGRSVQVVN